MKKVKNPFLSIDNYQCFACSPFNKSGLQLEFLADSDRVYTDFYLNSKFEGFPGITHGGIQSTIVDETMFWAVLEFVKKLSVTGKMEIQFKKPLGIDKKLTCYAKVIKANSRIVNCTSEIVDREKQVYCKARGVYIIPNRKMWEQASSVDLTKTDLINYI